MMMMGLKSDCLSIHFQDFWSSSTKHTLKAYHHPDLKYFKSISNNQYTHKYSITHLPTSQSYKSTNSTLNLHYSSYSNISIHPRNQLIHFTSNSFKQTDPIGSVLSPHSQWIHLVSSDLSDVTWGTQPDADTKKNAHLLDCGRLSIKSSSNIHPNRFLHPHPLFIISAWHR